VITRNGLNDEDFYQKKNGAGKFFRRLKNLELKDSTGALIIYSSTIQKLLESAENWPSSDTNHKQEVIAVAEKELLPQMAQAVELIEKNFKKYATVLEIFRHIYSVGLLAELAEKIKEYRLERNVFILSDSPVFISRVIDQNDAPFIYEKMGNRYNHYLIDEFQDTSVLQWKNFKPLISNALSSGNINLLVGDPKQSIYRWRNGNWEILARYIHSEYTPDILHVETQDTNWRSGEKIIQFNNALFPIAVLHLKNRLKTLFADSAIQPAEIDLLDSIFSDVVQHYPRRSEGTGNVFVKFFTKEEAAETPDYYGELLIDKINALLKEGFEMHEVAVLVREKSEGRNLTQFLIQANGEGRFLCDLSVLSEESLLLSASDAVNLIIAALRYINSPSDPLAGASLIATCRLLMNTGNKESTFNQVSFEGNSLGHSTVEKILPDFYSRIVELSSMPVYDLVENLIYIFNLNELASELPFIHALLDLLHEYSISNPSDLARFLDYWNETGCNRSVPASESQNALRL
jgi:ATP-dependent exoDNAse (exonuclease V) beta subunit